MVMKMRYLIAMLLPGLLWAQALEFELQPEAFPVEISGWQPFCPWAGGMDDTTPKLCDLDSDGDLDFFMGDQHGYIDYFQNVGTPSSPDFQYVTYFYDSLLNYYGNMLEPSDINFADIDGDGLLDAFVGGAYVFLHYNHGSATQPNFYGAPDTLFDLSGNVINGTHVALADVNADGKMDSFAGHYSG
jgi:hypothetical protein